jgi:Ca-activated chloride channel family protein
MVRSLLNRSPKWMVFGVIGVVGGLLFSLCAEPFVSAARPAMSPSANKAPIDLVFVLDVSGSMQREIDGVRASITEFTRQSEASGVQIRFALITFRDLSCGEPTLLAQGFTADPGVFASAMSVLRAGGGGDNEGESSLDGLRMAAGLPFGPVSRRVIVLITDETWHEPDGQIRSADDLTAELRAAGVESLHVVASAAVIGRFDFLTKAAPGGRFVLDASGRTAGGLSRLFQGVAQAVVGPSMLSRSAAGVKLDYSFESYLTQVFSVGAWLASVSVGVGFFLIAAQRFMLSGTLRMTGLARLLATATLLGAIAGVCGQTAYFVLSAVGLPDELGRAFAWVLVGGTLGLAMTYVIPNLPRFKSVLCAALGGLIGVVGFILIVSVMDFSDVGGRLIGAIMLGGSVGIAVAMAETIARDAYLVVHWAKNEKSTVNLGRTPVSIGTTTEATVRLSARTGYPSTVASFRLVDGQATLHNHMSQTTHTLKDGNKLTLGTVVIEVRIIH